MLDLLATDGDLSGEDAEVVALEDDPRSADLLDAVDEHRGDVLVLDAGDGDGVGLDDAALLLGDGDDVVTEQVGVVEVDGRDDGDLARR